MTSAVNTNGTIAKSGWLKYGALNPNDRNLLGDPAERKVRAAPITTADRKIQFI
jgi:hypothetical protein